jgi:hypothetical protein
MITSYFTRQYKNMAEYAQINAFAPRTETLKSKIRTQHQRLGARDSYLGQATAEIEDIAGT